jgi:hypothetical protein
MALCFIVLLFQENKSFGASTICIHPLMYVKPCREQLQFRISCSGTDPLPATAGFSTSDSRRTMKTGLSGQVASNCECSSIAFPWIIIIGSGDWKYFPSLINIDDGLLLYYTLKILLRISWRFLESPESSVHIVRIFR